MDKKAMIASARRRLAAMKAAPRKRIRKKQPIGHVTCNICQQPYDQTRSPEADALRIELYSLGINIDHIRHVDCPHCLVDRVKTQWLDIIEATLKNML